MPSAQTNMAADNGLTAFQPAVASWFRDTFAGPSPAQLAAWPVIRRRENMLLLAPTGSGKTLAAFLCAIDDLFRRARNGQLTAAIHVLYITPLKALGNDIHRNLTEPLAGVRANADGDLPEIRIGIRTGDTPQSERARMARTPPHILITTPESLYLLLQSRQIAPALEKIHTVIVDEVHALCCDKRGAHLAVSLERLEARLATPPQRIGCSATLSPLAEIAAFLVGFDDSGEQRPCTVVDAGMRKQLDVQVMAPLADFVETGHNALWASAYDLLLREVRQHTTTLIFCNSRYKAERTSLRLAELDEDTVRLGVHHGSVAKERRLTIEDDLKAGRLDGLVATTSLELGIDIGSVDLVYQLESPKSVATGLQRVGRAGHLLDATSKGRVLVFERDELLEAAAVCRAMVSGQIDDVRIPVGCLDVLAQQIAGAVVEKERRVPELLALLRRAYPYRNLSDRDWERVLTMLAGEHAFEMTMPPRALLMWDRTQDRLSPTRRAKQVTAMNVGTIGESSEYDVVIEGTKKRVGKVQSEFADDQLRVGEVFVLGSTSWRVAGVQKNRIFVSEAPGSTPTVPWWVGPIQSRTVKAGMRVGELRRQIADRIDAADLPDWLQHTYLLCPNAAKAVSDYVREQQLAVGVVPDHENLLVETWRDELGRTNVIVHCPLGERVNRTWGLALAESAKGELGQQWSVTASNDLLLLTFREPRVPPVHRPNAETLLGLLTADTVAARARAGAGAAIGLGSAFRDAAACALQLERTRQGRRVPVWLQNHRAQELFEAVGRDSDYPIWTEIHRSYLEENLDVAAVAHLLEQLAAGQITLHFHSVESPSPFAHSLLVMGSYRDSYEMGRDRRAHLLRLHRQVLQKVLSREQMAQLLDQRAIVRLEKRLLRQSEVTRARTPDELAQAVRELGDIPAGLEAVSAIVQGDAVATLAPLLEARRLVAVELPDCDVEPMRLVNAELWRAYHDAFFHSRKGARLTVRTPQCRNGALDCADSAPVSTR